MTRGHMGCGISSQSVEEERRRGQQRPPTCPAGLALIVTWWGSSSWHHELGSGSDPDLPFTALVKNITKDTPLCGVGRDACFTSCTKSLHGQKNSTGHSLHFMLQDDFVQNQPSPSLHPNV